MYLYANLYSFKFKSVIETKKSLSGLMALIHLVRMKGLEPSRREAYAPKAYVSTNSTTSAYLIL